MVIPLPLHFLVRFFLLYDFANDGLFCHKKHSLKKKALEQIAAQEKSRSLTKKDGMERRYRSTA
jgi:hypothetical protein